MPQRRNGDYEVGFSKPPKRSQFKPGQSGNPRGRPKGRKGLSALLQAELQTMIRVTEEGKTKRMTKLQAIVKRLVNALLKGDSKALALFTRLIHPTKNATHRPRKRRFRIGKSSSSMTSWAPPPGKDDDGEGLKNNSAPTRVGEGPDPHH